jgi:hypothetical protein
MPWVLKAPGAEGGLVTEGGATAAREDGGGRHLKRGTRRSADRVDVPVHPEEAAAVDAVNDRLVCQSDRDELRAVDDPVLAVRDPIDLGVDGT